MNTSTMNFTIQSSPKTKFSDAQILLQEFSGKRFTRNEAEAVWTHIVGHKWNMSEALGRDVGFRVATTDYIENFYQLNKPAKHPPRTLAGGLTILRSLRNAVRSYFEAKGVSISY